jgi:hypothetical protein
MDPLSKANADCGLTHEQFMKQLATMKDWPSIYAIFKRNLPGCPDDGFFAEGYDDVVVTALAKRWSNLHALKKLALRDRSFRDFVYQHISVTADANDLRGVLVNAQKRCPPDCSQLCSEITAHAKSAIAQLP